VRAAIADAGPIYYLALIGQTGILPILFGKVIIPFAVRDELAHRQAPDAVRLWIESPPDWLEFREPQKFADDALARN
jgi:predicted nucleic acid-binding protein